MNEFIVGEVSKNWTRQVHATLLHPGALLCGKFEEMIEFNRRRGYLLHSFQLHQLLTGPDEMSETIVAVFRRDKADASPALLAACRMLVDDPGITAGTNEVIKAAVARATGG